MMQLKLTAKHIHNSSWYRPQWAYLFTILIFFILFLRVVFCLKDWIFVFQNTRQRNFFIWWHNLKRFRRLAIVIRSTFTIFWLNWKDISFCTPIKYVRSNRKQIPCDWRLVLPLLYRYLENLAFSVIAFLYLHARKCMAQFFLCLCNNAETEHWR